MSASATLLCTPTLAEQHAWRANAAALVFTEFEKVSGTEFVLSGTTNLSDTTELTLSGVLDVLVGASPNGATASQSVQTFTTPSGHDSYRIGAGDEPLDDTFQDNRMELAASWAIEHQRALRSRHGVKSSMEFDYMSVGFDSQLEVDNETRDTTFAVGFAASHDRVHPVGGIPRPLASMQPEDQPQARVTAAKTKNVFDLLAGVSQVLGPRTILQFNYTHTFSEGYHTDPYKLVSVVDAVSGATLDYVHERRPEERSIDAIYLRVKHRADSAIIDAGLRLTDDDWGVASTTLELRYRVLNGVRYWQPTLRWYRQHAADFYRHSIAGAVPSEDVSADRRLADFDAVTFGVTWGELRDADNGYSVSVEYYQQIGDESPDDAVGEQRSLDLFPETRALLVQFNNLFVW